MAQRYEKYAEHLHGTARSYPSEDLKHFVARVTYSSTSSRQLLNAWLSSSVALGLKRDSARLK